MKIHYNHTNASISYCAVFKRQKVKWKRKSNCFQEARKGVLRYLRQSEWNDLNN